VVTIVVKLLKVGSNLANTWLLFFVFRPHTHTHAHVEGGNTDWVAAPLQISNTVHLLHTGTIHCLALARNPHRNWGVLYLSGTQLSQAVIGTDLSQGVRTSWVNGAHSATFLHVDPRRNSLNAIAGLIRSLRVNSTVTTALAFLPGHSPECLRDVTGSARVDEIQPLQFSKMHA
jgi:hypothetical protein